MIWYILSFLCFIYIMAGILKISEYSFAGINYKAIDKYAFNRFNLTTVLLGSMVIGMGELYGFFMISIVVATTVAIYARNELTPMSRAMETSIYIFGRLLMFGMSIYAIIMLIKLLFV